MLRTSEVRTGVSWVPSEAALLHAICPHEATTATNANPVERAFKFLYCVIRTGRLDATLKRRSTNRAHLFFIGRQSLFIIMLVRPQSFFEVRFGLPERSNGFVIVGVGL